MTANYEQFSYSESWFAGIWPLASNQFLIPRRGYSLTRRAERDRQRRQEREILNLPKDLDPSEINRWRWKLSSTVDDLPSTAWTCHWYQSDDKSACRGSNTLWRCIQLRTCQMVADGWRLHSGTLRMNGFLRCWDRTRLRILVVLFFTVVVWLRLSLRLSFVKMSAWKVFACRSRHWPDGHFRQDSWNVMLLWPAYAVSQI